MNIEWNELTVYPPKEWSGEGLPPVGTVCEYTKPDEYKGRERVWFKCYVVAHDQGGVVIRTEKNHYHLRKIPEYIFRPLKSDKEKWVDQVIRIYDEKDEGARENFARLYDALTSGTLTVPKVTK